MKKIAITLGLVLVSVMLVAGVTQHYQMENPKIEKSSLGLKIKLSGAQSYGQAGEPDLPYFGFSILLPEANEASSIQVRRENPVVYKFSEKVAPIQPQYPFSHGVLEKPVEASMSIYSSESAFPKNTTKGLRTEFLCGHPIAFGAVSPFEYYPVKDELVFYREIWIDIEYKPGLQAQKALSLLKKDPFVSRRIMDSVDNKSMVPTYRTYRDAGIEYLMIIDAEKIGNWQPLANYYENIGMSVSMKAVSEIEASMPGIDLQEKIRNYIISIFQENPLRYVLLGGDTDVIPHRGFMVSMGDEGETDYDIPADMYYSNLDSNWNDDMDDYWGEMMETDLVAEVAVGRICYNNDTEISNQINKICLYQMLPVEDAIKTASFVGEWLWDGPTWGGDYMDEMIGGSNANGYTTIGVPPDWEISTLYDRTYGYSDAWGSTQIRPFLSEGANLVNHLGHSATTYNMRLSNNQVSDSNITNSNYSIYFTQGCYAGSFDNRDTSPGSYTADCITEKYTSVTKAAAGMIAHSRYGWGMQGSTNGASQRYHREYIDAIFGEGIHDLGYTLVDSKVDNISYMTNTPVLYWVCYETNLFGCPAMQIWSDTPQMILADLPNAWMVGLNDYTISSNAANGHLRIKLGDELIHESYADEFGTFQIQLTQNLVPGTYQMYINAPNYYSYNTSIYVTASQMPYIVCNEVLNSDEDGLLHTGEILSLSATIKNMGMVDQEGSGTISISSSSQNIEVLQGTYSFSNIAAGDSLIVSEAFQIQIVGSFADQSVANLIFTANYGEYESSSLHSIVLAAPRLSLESYQVSSDGMYVVPGGTASISFNLENSGSGNAHNPILLIFPEDPQLSTSEFEIILDPINSGEVISFNNVLTVNVAETAEMGASLAIGYIISAENGNSIDGSFLVNIGLMSYGFEPDIQNWTSEQLNSQFVNQWHRTSSRNITEGGEWSMKFGGSGTSQYASSAYGALVSPDITVYPGSSLKFWHWMDAEDHDDYPNRAWDGGLVQMSVNGGGWSAIEPVGGYPQTIYNNPDSPFASGTPVYSGTFSWTEAEFPLGNVSGEVKFRFVFGSDAYVTGEGWYIDDIRVEGSSNSNDETVVPIAISLAQNYPNPFNPNTNIAFYLPKSAKVRLSVYNLKGQLVKDLVDKDLPAGQNIFNWNGTDNNGSLVASGIYSYRLQSENQSISKKMILMK